jgi:hypothetical protein
MHMATMKGMSKKSQAATAKATQTASEAIENIRTVASFCTQDWVHAKYQSQLKVILQWIHPMELIQTFSPLKIGTNENRT